MFSELFTHQVQLISWQDEIADEDRENISEQRRRQGDPVFYGATIQLFHVLTGEYVRVSSTATCTLEPTNMRVDLNKQAFISALFRIMPRYKVTTKNQFILCTKTAYILGAQLRAEGDPVRMEDQVVLESIKTPGQVLQYYWFTTGDSFFC
jgi:hypothetical protein